MMMMTTAAVTAATVSVVGDEWGKEKQI